MPKSRIFYIVSLVILGVLIGFTIVRPPINGREYSEVQREHVIQTEDEWIIQYDIINNEGKDTNYTITVTFDEKSYKQDVRIRDGKIFTYIHHLYPDRITEGCATFTICKESEDTPLEECTYYLK